MSLTPMMQQYMDIKSEYQDALLMFRLGDFYELFFEDAVTASKVLEITLTGRDAGSQGRAPMCGVPFHAAEQYVSRLIDAGYCVAICEQVEDPKQTKGLVRREVVRVVTPGTTYRDDTENNRFLCALVWTKHVWGLSFVDVATGEVWCAERNETDGVVEVLEQWRPCELLMYRNHEEDSDNPVRDEWSDIHTWCEHTSVRKTYVDPPKHLHTTAVASVQKQYNVSSLLPLDLEGLDAATAAVGMALDYVRNTQKTVLTHLKTPKNILAERNLVLDHTALRNLEVVETNRSRQRKGSLYGLLDMSRTAMGSRLLRRWLERPLADATLIRRRLDAVEVFVNDLFLRSQLHELLDAVYDLERLLGKVSFGSANARDLVALARSLAVVPHVRDLLVGTSDKLLQDIGEHLPDVSSLVAEIERLIVDNPPVSVREGGFIRDGADEALDELRTANTGGKVWLAQLEQREKDRTGIRTLKIGYNKVFGYYIEVSKASAHLVPADYERRQTLANAERYTLAELKDQESRILNAEEKSVEREYQLFSELRGQVLDHLADIQRIAEQIAMADVLCSLGFVSAEHQYVRPELSENRGVHIVQGRHPVVEAAHPGKFVPNDVALGVGPDLILITGPNMAGKSTYMRQTALIVILAHIGCFVPAQSAALGVVDRIFTRIGASDDLGAGQSTFMVEMVELAQILRQATNRSLVLLDEIGRGTSTYDGMSIAESVMEALQQEGRTPLTLFATHYHELTEKAEALPSVANVSVRVEENDQGIVFLHSVVNRPADKSYGIQVAKLAGIPSEVTRRAEEILKLREAGIRPGGNSVDKPLISEPRIPAPVSEIPPAFADIQSNAGVHAAAAQESMEGTLDLPLFASPFSGLVERLANVNLYEMTPMEAMNVLFGLAKEAQEVVKWDKSK